MTPPRDPDPGAPRGTSRPQTAGNLLAWALCAISLGLLLGAARHGIGLHSDTIHYFRFARTGAVQDLPTYHGPLYAVLIWLATRAGLTPPSGALLVNAIAATASVQIVWLGFRRWWGLGALGAALLVAVSYPFVYNCAWAMSEATFFPLLLAFAWTLTRWHEAPSPALAAVAGLLAAAATLTRYAGFALVGGGGLLLALAALRDPRRWLQLVVYGAAFALSFGPYYLWNVSRSGSGIHREFGLTPVTAHTYWGGLATVSEWLMPYKLYALLGPAPALLLAAALGAALLFFTVRALRCGRPHVFVPAILALAYAGLVNISIRLSDMQTPLDHRILAPLYLLLLLAAAGQAGARGRPHAGWWAALLYVAALNGWRDMTFLRAVEWQGIGYAAPAWRDNSLMALVREQAATRTFYSNAPDAVELLTGIRTVRWIPFAKDMYTRRPNEHFTEQVAAMAEDMRLHHAAVVFFRAKHASDRDTPDYLPSVGVLKSLVDGTAEEDNRDGVLLAPAARPAAGTGP